MMSNLPYAGMDQATSLRVQPALDKLKDQPSDEPQPDPGKMPDGYWTGLAAKHSETIAAGQQYVN